MTDPLQYLRDLQVAAIPRARPPLPRPVAPQAKVPAPAAAQAGFLDPCDLPALAMQILAEGRAANPPAPAPRRYLQRCVLPGGARCSLPIRYFDARCLIATFATERARAREALQRFGLQPAGDDAEAAVLFGCFEYRDTDLGPYNEVALSLPAVAPGDDEPALFVLQLPVTTAETDRIGRALWGYPKFVAGIDISGDSRAFSTHLRDGAGAAIAAFEGVFAPLSPSPPTDFATYSMLGDRLLRTRIEALTPFQQGDGAGFSLQVGPSSHPMTQALRALGLDGARPSRVRYADPYQTLLFPGFPV
ncbi:MAG: acetoacetate decarboxylase family protein [Pseudomonadota bacterium]|nr:acetoacetate decarboxylase family protein [Pseudomonadota bacterium]